MSASNEQVLALDAIREALNHYERDYYTADGALGVIREILECGQISKAASDVIAERVRQITGEGWSTTHDDVHTSGELADAGAYYAARAGRQLSGVVTGVLVVWPFDRSWIKPPTTPRRDLVKAAALLIAEIERIDRETARRLTNEIERMKPLHSGDESVTAPPRAEG